MSVRIKVDKKFWPKTEDEMAGRMLVAAVYLASQHQQKLGKSNPAPHNKPSKPGEYPRKRTGFLQKSVGWSPGNVLAVKTAKKIQIGYDANAFYGPVLEIMQKRLGLLKTFTDLLPQLSVIVSKPLKAAT